MPCHKCPKCGETKLKTQVLLLSLYITITHFCSPWLEHCNTRVADLDRYGFPVTRKMQCAAHSVFLGFCYFLLDHAHGSFIVSLANYISLIDSYNCPSKGRLGSSETTVGIWIHWPNLLCLWIQTLLHTIVPVIFFPRSSVLCGVTEAELSSASQRRRHHEVSKIFIWEQKHSPSSFTSFIFESKQIPSQQNCDNHITISHPPFVHPMRVKQ